MARSTIVGLFDDEQRVHNIESELQNRGVDEGQTQALNWNDLSSGNDPWGIGKDRNEDNEVKDKLADELKARGVPDDDARDFAEAVRRGGNLVVTEIDDDAKADEVARYLDQQGAIDLDDRRKSWRSEGAGVGDVGTRESTRTSSTGEEAHLEEAREELRVGKRDTEKGRVRVHKRVEEKPVEEEVSLREERADIERENVDRPAGDEAFDEESFEVTEHAEEPVVEKEARVTEEVRVDKEDVERTETVRDTVRETHIDIEELSADVPEEHSYSQHESDYREHFTNQFGESDRDYSDYQPAYRFGHTIGASDRFEGRDYDELEPDVRRSYESEYGEGSYDEYRDALRQGFETARKRRRS